jgi:hypothetical protein
MRSLSKQAFHLPVEKRRLRYTNQTINIREIIVAYFEKQMEYIHTLTL